MGNPSATILNPHWPTLNIFFKTLHIHVLRKDTKVGSQNFGYQIWFCTRLLIGQTVSMHLQTNCWAGWTRIWWINQYGPPKDWLTFHAPLIFSCYIVWPLANLWSSFHAFADKAQIWWANSLWASPDLINFWTGSTEFFFCFLASDWLSSFLAFADKLLIRLGTNLVG